MVIPKGRLSSNIIQLLNDAGLEIKLSERDYKPRCGFPNIDIKIMKPQNIPQLIQLGSHDIGFAGWDWVVENQVSVTELMDLGFDPVRIVAAVPENSSEIFRSGQKLIVASEYVNISREYLEKNSSDYLIIRTYGATEVFPPDDADMIIDNTSSGATLKQNKLKIIDTLLYSTTRMIANPKALKDREKSSIIETVKTLLKSVIDARKRVMLEMNVKAENLEGIIRDLPCMKSPTISQLYGSSGYAVKIAVPKQGVSELISRLKQMGASDILETEFRKVVL